MKSYWQFLIITILGLILSLGFSLTLKAQVLPAQLVQQAQQYYQVGEFEESINLLEQANQIYQNQKQTLQQAQVLSLTSLPQQQLNNWEAARQNIAASRRIIVSIAPSNSKSQVLAQIWHIEAHFQFLTGHEQQALEDWKQAEKLYRQIGDRLGIAGTLLNQAQALVKMGFYRRAGNSVLAGFNYPDYDCENLTVFQIQTIIKQATKKAYSWQVEGLNSLGNSLLLMGKLSQAQALIEASQKINSNSPQSSPLNEAKILLSLGNINKAIALQARDRKNWQNFNAHSQIAINYWQQLDNYQKYPYINHAYRLPAQLNQLSLLITNQQWSKAKALVNCINLDTDDNLHQLNLTAAVKFAHSLELLKQHNIPLNYSGQDIANLYLQVIKQAQAVDNRRIQSYALGYLGHLTQEQPNLKLNATPQKLTEQALNLAQADQALEVAYRWQWQLGKLYRQQGQRKIAIASYRSALASLNDLRSDLVTLTTEVQFDFKEQIEPIYREFADLLLQRNPSNTDLEMARNVIEALQVAELDNYFQDACTLFKPKRIDQIDRNAAVIYTIVLPKRLEVILAMNDAQSTSGGQVFHYHTQVLSQEKLEATITQLRQYITEPDRMLEVQKLSAEIYDWLIKPFTADLNQQPPKTLVFVLDNILQTIPMSALYDGKQYLIEKYAIALTPGLRLLNPQPTSEQPVVLAGGVSQPLEVANQRFSALSYVTKELNIFTSSNNNQVLLNQQFTATNLINQLNAISPSRIHLATHAQFSSDPNQTFVLLWQQLLNIKDFSSLLLNRQQALTNPIDLLVLSACDTATGDRRATLGLAGIAVRSGSTSTVATLWRVNDDSTAEFMNNFYQQLAIHNKAEALRQAQLKLWQVSGKDWQVPAFWSAYVLIGNWQS
jgi:CHAT domain-containing protein